MPVHGHQEDEDGSKPRFDTATRESLMNFQLFHA